MSFDDEAALAEFFEGGGKREAFDESEVASAVAIFGVEEAVFEGFFVGEEEETFGIEVESADGEDFWRK